MSRILSRIDMNLPLFLVAFHERGLSGIERCRSDK